MEYLKRFRDKFFSKKEKELELQMSKTCDGYYKLLYAPSDAQDNFWSSSEKQINFDRSVNISKTLYNFVKNYKDNFLYMKLSNLENSIPCTYIVMTNKDLYVSVREMRDEYFIVCLKIKTNYRYYICDQYDGLEKLFKDIGFTNRF